MQPSTIEEAAMTGNPEETPATADQQDPEWPRRCEECGTELEQAQVEFAEAEFSEGRTGTPVATDFCPNPECPRHQRESGAGGPGLTE
jgi:hypothetical protein